MGWLLAITVLVLGVVLAIAGVRNTHAELFAAITGHTAKPSTGSAASTAPSSSTKIVAQARTLQNPNAAPMTIVGHG